MTTEDMKNRLIKLWVNVKKWAIRFGKAAWAYIKQAKIELIAVAAVILADQITKAVIDATMELNGSPLVLIPQFLEFDYSRNPKAAFGSMFGLDDWLGQSGAMTVLIVVTFIAVGFFSFFMYRNRGKSRLCLVSYAMIIGGAVGNLIDRMALGEVRDFIRFVYFGGEVCGQTGFATFNIADASLVIGVILFALFYIILYREPEKDKKARTGIEGDTEDEPIYEDDDAAAASAKSAALTEKEREQAPEKRDNAPTDDRDKSA